MRTACLAAIFVGMLAVGSEAAPNGRTGREIYRKQCARCHGGNGQGVVKVNEKPLTGNRSLAELTKVIHDTMPEEKPELCVGDDARRVAQYIYNAFYSPRARSKNGPARIELARLTAPQYLNSVADLVSGENGPARVGPARGMKAEYFKGRRFRRNERVEQRVDPRIVFEFGDKSPHKLIKDSKEFSIRWSGAVIAEETGEFEFSIRTEIGARLWVNDFATPKIDAWVASKGRPKTHTTTVTLLGGRAYPIRLDVFKYKDKTASIVLEWKPPHKAREPIPNRCLAPQGVATTFVASTPFPADDRVSGYERGVSVSKAWDESTTQAAIETANALLPRIAAAGRSSGRGRRGGNRSRGKSSGGDVKQRVMEFCRRFAERAFRRPLTTTQKRFFVDVHFERSASLESAVKRSVLLILKSPRFLYPGVGAKGFDDYDVANRLALGLWDSLPDRTLLEAAAKGQLKTATQVEQQANRMLADPRAKAKLRHVFHEWLQMDEKESIPKDKNLFPEFDERLTSDLRTSLDLFIDSVVWSKDSDYRRLLLAEHAFVNPRIAKFYGLQQAATGADDAFQRVEFEPGKRAGVLTHPYLLSMFAYHNLSSPIHRGVFLTRRVMGRSLKPPPQATEFKDGSFDPHMTTREKVTLITKSTSCMTCHSVINPLGFSLEHFDAVGRFREQEKKRPIDASSDYETVAGKRVKLNGARSLAEVVESMKPLEPFKDRTLILNGISDRIRGDGDSHMRGMSCLLTGIELFPGNIQGGSHTPAGWASGISIDQQLKQFLQSRPETRTRFGSLEFGVNVPKRSDPWTRMVYAGPNKPVTPIDDPYQMFEKLYGRMKDKKELQSILDDLRADLKKVRNAVSSADRKLLEEHETFVRQMERELKADRKQQLAIAPPTQPAGVRNVNDNMPRLVNGPKHFALSAEFLGNSATSAATVQGHFEIPTFDIPSTFEFRHSPIGHWPRDLGAFPWGRVPVLQECVVGTSGGRASHTLAPCFRHKTETISMSDSANQLNTDRRIPTLRWVGDASSGRLWMIDQTLLPTETLEIECTTVEQVWEAIKMLRVRGAPAIGVAAAYGVVVGLQTVTTEGIDAFHDRLEEVTSYLATSRPTAVNLFWALERMRDSIAAATSATPAELHDLLLTEAKTIEAEDREMCAAIGRHGAALLSDGQGVLTHCNAGGLATAGDGTALSVIFAAAAEGKQLQVYADETRPLLQGSRLTAWELDQRGIPVTVICDSMAGWVMKEQRIGAVVTGADRIAGNGDVANKIGTYSVALLARAHGIPFYVAAPSSTFDLSLSSGAEIPIEERAPAEITNGFGRETAPQGIGVYNPAFDVTPAEYVSAIITERGVISPVNAESAIFQASTHRLTHAVAPDESVAATLATASPALRIVPDWEELLNVPDLDAVIVGGFDETAMQGAKQLASAGKSILLLPDKRQDSAWVYEMTLIRDDNGVVLLPVFPLRDDPAVLKLRQAIDTGAIGKVLHLNMERETHVDIAGNTTPLLKVDAVNAALLFDVDLLRAVGGNYNRITALHSGAVDNRVSLATVTLAGNDVPEASWSARPVTTPSRWTLRVVGETGQFTLSCPNLAEPAAAQELTLEGPGIETESEPETSTASSADRLLERLEAARQGERVSPDWTDLTRDFEIVDATARSLRRRRTIDLHFETASERNQFKTQMTAIGCGLISMTIVSVIFLLIINAMFDLHPAVMHVMSHRRARGFAPQPRQGVRQVQHFQPANRPLPNQILAMPTVQETLEVVHHRSQLLVARGNIVRTAIADNSVIDIVQFSPREISIIGLGMGATNLTIWFENNPQPLIYLVKTVPDPSIEEQKRLDYGRLERKLAVLFPNSKVYLIPLSGKIVVKGQARSATEAARILQIVRNEVINQEGRLGGPQPGQNGLVGGVTPGNANQVLANSGAAAGAPGLRAADLTSSYIVNMLEVPGEYQVMLRVRIAELNRSQLRRMGIDFNYLLNGGQHAVSYALGGLPSSITGVFENGEIGVLVNWLASNGTAKILSEPVLTVLSGHSASMLSGGEFAVPTIVGIGGAQGQQTSFRGFGTSLLVTPTVLDRDLIRMQIVPEFSQINQGNAVQGIPGVDSRRVQTTIELREGQTIAIAGLLSHRMNTEITRIPFLSDIPYIGSKLFAAKSSTMDETELLVLVTPELVRPMDADEVPPVPGFNVTPPDDHSLYFYGALEGPPDNEYYQLAPYGRGAGVGEPIGYRLHNPSPATPGYPPAVTDPYGQNAPGQRSPAPRVPQQRDMRRTVPRYQQQDSNPQDSRSSGNRSPSRRRVGTVPVGYGSGNSAGRRAPRKSLFSLLGLSGREANR
eukprot:g8339.t1